MTGKLALRTVALGYLALLLVVPVGMVFYRALENGIGPDWEGLYGSTVTLDDGSTLVADEAYLLESIVDPDAKKVDGYSIGMPVNDALSDEDIASIIAYIQSLGGDDGGPSSS